MTRSLADAGRTRMSAAPPGPRAASRMATPAERVLALQRRAGNAAVGALLGRAGAPGTSRLARCAGGGCRCERCAAGRERDEERDGKGLAPEPDLSEELEGRARLSRATATGPRRLQRLSIKQHAFHQGRCGERNVQWVFSLDNAAPADGYIVQHITSLELIADCPGPVEGPPAPTKEFWEAWLVKKGDKVDWTTTRDAWTDGSTRPATPAKNGVQVSNGELKFFLKSKTGDLGDFGVAPATPGSAWGPGKVPTSGALPSTPTKPSWWDDAPTEGPAVRFAESRWNCCGPDASKHTSVVRATS